MARTKNATYSLGEKPPRAPGAVVEIQDAVSGQEDPNICLKSTVEITPEEAAALQIDLDGYIREKVAARRKMIAAQQPTRQPDKIVVGKGKSLHIDLEESGSEDEKSGGDDEIADSDAENLDDDLEDVRAEDDENVVNDENSEEEQAESDEDALEGDEVDVDEVEMVDNAYVPTFEEIAEQNAAHHAAERRENAVKDRKRKRAIDEEKELANDGDYIPVEDTEADEPDEILPTKRGIAQKKCEKKVETDKEDIKDYYAAFATTGFTNTHYPHIDTMKEMGIYKDIMRLLETIGLEKFVFMNLRTHEQASAEFLATIRIEEFRDNAALMEKFGGGIVTFTYKKQPKSVSYKKLNKYFGFMLGEPSKQEVSKEEQAETWTWLTGDETRPRQARGNAIRSPVISYFRKILAETFLSRNSSGLVTTGDLRLLSTVLSKIFTQNPVTKTPLLGDTNRAGMASVLCRYLEGFRSKLNTLHRKGHNMEKITVGGSITGILVVAGVQFDKEDARAIPPKFINARYLVVNQMMRPSRDEAKFLYTFRLRGNNNAMIALPNTSITSFDDPRNVTFAPPDSMLYVESSDVPSSRARISSAEKISGQTGPSKKKSRAIASPTERVDVERCVCTQDGYREELIADIMGRMQKQIDMGIEKGLAELGKKFMTKSAYSLQRLAHGRDVEDAGTTPVSGRPAVGSGITSATRTTTSERTREYAGSSTRPSGERPSVPHREKTSANRSRVQGPPPPRRRT